MLCKKLIFGGYLILVILAVKAKSAKILVHQYCMQSLSEAQIIKKNLMSIYNNFLTIHETIHCDIPFEVILIHKTMYSFIHKK